MTRKHKTARRLWSAVEVAILHAHYPTTRTADMVPMLPGRQIHTIQDKAASLGIRKTRECIAAMARAISARPDHPFHQYQFTNGMIAWNAGPSYTAGGRSAEHRFQKGHRGGRALEVYKPIGTERISKDGYLERKINEALPFQRRWRAVHILLWEAEHGPLPKGHAIVFKNRDKTDIRLDNLELITRADLLRRNSVHNYGPEIAAVAQLKGAITRQINRRNAA